MMTLNKLILVVSLISSGYLASMEALPTGPSKMEAAVKFVDDYLTKHAKSDDIEGNIRAARQLKEEVSDSDSEEDSEETQKERIARVAGGLAYLKELFESERTHKCDMFGYYALFNVNMYTKGGLEDDNSTSRVAMIGRHFMKRHAEECGRDYESRLEAEMKNVDPFLMEKIDAYVGVDITFIQPPVKYIMDGIAGEHELRFNAQQAQQAYDALKKLTQNYPADSQLLTAPVQADNVKDLFKKYFVSACEDLYQEIADVALPAIFDNEAVTHGELPEIYKKFIECEARRPFDYSGLAEEISKISGQ